MTHITQIYGTRKILLGEKYDSRAAWDIRTANLKTAQKKGNEREASSRKQVALLKGSTCEDNNSNVIKNEEGQTVGERSIITKAYKDATCRPDSICYQGEKELKAMTVVHESKSFVNPKDLRTDQDALGGGEEEYNKDQVIYKTHQIDAERALAKDNNVPFVLTISSENAKPNGKPPRPRPSTDLGETTLVADADEAISEIYLMQNDQITHMWVYNPKKTEDKQYKGHWKPMPSKGR